MQPASHLCRRKSQNEENSGGKKGKSALPTLKTRISTFSVLNRPMSAAPFDNISFLVGATGSNFVSKPEKP